MKKDIDLIEYKNNVGSFTIANEIMGAAIKRKKILKHPDKKSHTFLVNWLLMAIKVFAALFIIDILFILIGEKFNISEDSFLEFFGSLIGFSIIFLIWLLLLFLSNIIKINKKKPNRSKQEVRIDKDGIKDLFTNYDVDVLCTWDKIIGITYTRNFIVLFTKNSDFYLWYPKNEAIIDKIKKYKKEIFTRNV